MSELGSGSGSSYPTTVDTDSTLEINSPSASKTKARAEVPNDLAAAIIAVQTELGTDPAGTVANVKTFLQTEHDADGTHAAITASTISASGQITSTVSTGTAPLVIASTTEVANLKVATATLATTATTANNLAMTGEASAKLTSGDVALPNGTPTDIITLNLGTVTSGDRVSVQGIGSVTKDTTAGTVRIQLVKSSGTATVKVGADLTTALGGQTVYLPANESGAIYNVKSDLQITGNGTLIIALNGYVATGAATALNNSNQIYVFFLKKQ